ncbi:hypothetical protein QYE76_061099 [Lolium multiflorum]|uniref:Retrotransposon gag domain-containing protein n=1 Tax=Lolium multiflorum TaxID=4521 RepID=A0AAD8W6W0_LOLMU|nr:hypothetical protein QYE76_061099 [Lolium multiflorum]
MGKPRDTKIAILPSTTRKGTTLSTSAALDSPSVISKLVSPPQASNAGTSAESENSSYNCDDASAVLDNDGSLGSFLDATIARSRQIENTETPNENAATPVNSPESVEYSSDDLDEDYVELDDDFIEKCNATTDARKIKKLLAEHAVRYKLSPDPKFATSPINIRDKDYDFSLDLSHIAIVEKTPFCGTEKESAVEHMTELSTLSGLFSDDIKMRTYFVAKIFPFSLKDDAKTWYNNLPPGSIKSPKELLDVFFRKYFPASAQHAALQRIYNFDQEDGEKLPEAWARFCSLIRAQPDHDLEKHDLLDIFYSGLTIESRAYLDSCAGCVFRKRTPDDAEELLAKIGRNHDDWSTPEPTPTPILKKRGMIKLNDEDMREAKKSLKEKGIKPEDVKNLPPIEDLCEITPPSSMIEVHSLQRFTREDIPYSKPPAQCLDEFDNYIVKQENFNMRVENHLMENSRAISELHGIVERTSNDVKILVKHFHMVQTQIDQLTKVQNDLLGNNSKEKHAYEVTTRGGVSTQDPLYPEGHPKRVEQDSQLTKTSAPSKKKKKKHKNVVESSEPVNDPNSISISDAETESGNEHDKDNDKDDTPDKEEVEKEPEKHAKNKKYTKEDFIAEKHGNEREPWVQKQMPFPAKKLKSKEEEHYNKFCDWMKPLFLQIPLTDAIKLPPYSKYMKDIVSNKRKIPNEEISTMLANYSFNGKIPKKLGDPGIPTIPCSIKNNYVRTALCDLGAGVSVMPFSLYKRLDLDKLIPTDISLQMADKSTAIPVGVCENVPVQVTQHCLILTDFVVLEMPEDDNMSIILGRPFLNTAGAVIDCNKGMVTFNVDDKEHTVYFPKRIDKVYGVNTISNVKTIKVGTIDCPIYEPKEEYQTLVIGSISIQYKVTHSGTPGGTSSATSTSTPTSEMAEEQITYEDLPPAEHKKKYDELKAIVEAELIGSFEKTRAHGIRFKGFTPQGVLEGSALRDQFGILPKKKIIGYSKPYPNEFDLIPLPPKYRLPDFTKFSGSEGSSSIEHRLTLYEQRHPELYQDKFKRAISLVNADEDEDSAEDQEVAVAEWTRTAVPVSCKWVNPPGPPRGFDFDVSKAEQIFDLLLKEKQLKLPEGHKIPTAQEMNKRPYCKWHHTFTHATNDCKVLRAQIQMVIESGRLTFGQFAMKVDMRPFPDVNMVDLSHSIREPGFSFDVNMAGLVGRHGEDKSESSHSRGKDKEEAVPRDRPQDDDRRYLTEEEVRAYGINAHYPCISSTNMSSSTTDVGATTKTTKDIVGRCKQEVSSHAETTTGTSFTLEGGQGNKTTWTSTGTVLSSNIAGTLE